MKERNEIGVTDNCDNRIQVFSSDGIFLRLFGSETVIKGRIILVG